MKGTSRYIALRSGTTRLICGADNLWRDETGCIWALVDPKSSTDKVETCGAFGLNLPDTAYFRPLNDACRPHDYAYSAPAYQAFHSREEADAYLESLLRIQGYGFIGRVFRKISSWFGKGLWEGDR